MFHIAICDDNVKDTLRIQSIVKNYMDKSLIPYKILKFHSVDELLNGIKKLNLIFMDIFMNGINGIQTGKKIREINRNAKIIYTTSFQQYCRQAVNNVHAFAYLEKPVTNVMVEYQLSEIIQCMQEENRKSLCIKFEIISISEERLLEKKIKDFEVKDIYYFEYINRRIKIKLDTDEYYFIDNMKSLMNKMQLHNFEMCHQNYLVNLMHIKNIKGYDVFLDNKEIIPVSQKKSSEFRKKINRFIQTSIEKE